MANFKISQTSTHVDFLNVAEKAFSLLFTLFKAVRDFHCVTVPKRSIILIIKYLTSIHRKESLLSRGGTPLYKPYRHVPPHRLGFLRRFGLKTGIHFTHFCLELGMVFEGTVRKCMNVFIVSIPNE